MQPLHFRFRKDDADDIETSRNPVYGTGQDNSMMTSKCPETQCMEQDRTTPQPDHQTQQTINMIIYKLVANDLICRAARNRRFFRTGGTRGL